uniref:Peroxiredoxin-like 2 activated in M-CSF stimulated monocytes n=1 Tax=Prymnesium polylepis TaxID=72548 RepID=A0A6V4SN97_9EUKA|mmetsp:Transcript_50112/g.138852  ORF Transcript_50112/g.138852 Transcript_50112/m.138852 type:complete len:118 (-) Transcript_50112:267-620(-)
MLGVEEFRTGYFCGPLYQDPEREFYKILGSKPIFTFGGIGKALLNPLKLRRELKEMGERQKAKNVEGNMQGDGLTKGGILVISPQDEILHTFYEEPGNGVPKEEAAKIIAAVRSIRK